MPNIVKGIMSARPGANFYPSNLGTIMKVDSFLSELFFVLTLDSHAKFENSRIAKSYSLSRRHCHTHTVRQHLGII